MAKPNILMLSYNRIGRGTYWRALGFSKELVRQDYDVTLLAVAPNRKFGFSNKKVDGVTVIETPDLIPRSGYDPWDAINRITWVHKRRFDLVHTFETRPVNIFPALFIRHQHEIPVISDWCDWFGKGGSVEQRPLLTRLGLRPLETFFEQHFRPKLEGITVINRILKQRAFALGISANDLLLLPNGADVHHFAPRKIKKVRHDLSLPDDKIILGYTGAMFKADAELMASAFNIVHRERPDTLLLLIGYGDNKLNGLVEDSRAVIHTGAVNYEDLAKYVAACDLGWLPLADLPANRGRSPMKVNDFIASARPVVVSDVGGLGEFIREHKLGWTAAPNAVAQAEALLHCIVDLEHLHDMGLSAHDFATNRLSWSVITETLVNFYHKYL